MRAATFSGGGQLVSPRPTRRSGERRDEKGRAGCMRSAFLRGGYFSPASTLALSTFCFGGSGHVVNALNAHGGLYARFRSSMKVVPGSGFSST